MTSQTDLANLALSRLGDDIISDLDEGSRPANLCKRHYDATLNALLREYQWNCATKRATLAASTAVPDFGFAYAYPLPSDFLRLVRIFDGCDLDYRIENGSILSDESTCEIEYVATITDPNMMDALLQDVFAQRLAAEIAFSLTKNASLSEQAWNVYNAKIRTARTIDSMEGKPRGIEADAWTGARL